MIPVSQRKPNYFFVNTSPAASGDSKAVSSLKERMKRNMGSDSIEEDVSNLITSVDKADLASKDTVSAMTSVETNSSLAMEREKGRKTNARLFLSLRYFTL